ncbi:MAG: class I SAM-dependent RNA methyltransferase [Nitrospirae bacterium]|nr:class I SAM-dependent RNA methyltransferase [Nitrospirota bacterium]
MAALEELLVTGIANGGYGIARTAVGGVFVDGAIPGELVQARIVRSVRQSRFADVESVISPSPRRVDPQCPLFGECGGCRWQFIDYPAQVAFKVEILRDCLRRIGGIDFHPSSTPLAGGSVNSPPLVGEAFGYRYRARLSVSKRGEIGFLRRNSHDVVAFENCIILRDELNEAIRRIRSAAKFKAGGEIIVVCGDHGIAAAVNGDFIAGSITDKMRFIRETGLSGLDVNGKRFGNPAIAFDLSGLQYTVSARSFFQANWRLNLKMVQAVCELAPKGARIADIYAGAGNFAIALAARGHDVTAVEGDKSSSADGERNARQIKSGNIRFIRKSAEAAIAKLQPADAMIVDPPRAGMEPAAVEAIMRMKPQRLIYVSCDPATLARDMKKLARLYDVESLRLIDMFPQTGHIEALAEMRLR